MRYHKDFIRIKNEAFIKPANAPYKSGAAITTTPTPTPTPPHSVKGERSTT